MSKKGYTRSPVNITGTGATAEQTLAAFKSIMVEYKKDYSKYPDRIQSDNGSHFLGAFEKAFQPGGFFHQKIRYNSGLRYRATSQSVVERFNGTLRNMIRRYMNDTEQGGNDWFKHLQQFVQTIIRTSIVVLKLPLIKLIIIMFRSTRII
jgi:hypothetical protein